MHEALNDNHHLPILETKEFILTTGNVNATYRLYDSL